MSKPSIAHRVACLLAGHHLRPTGERSKLVCVRCGHELGEK